MTKTTRPYYPSIPVELRLLPRQEKFFTITCTRSNMVIALFDRLDSVVDYMRLLGIPADQPSNLKFVILRNLDAHLAYTFCEDGECQHSYIVQRLQLGFSPFVI